MCPAEWRQRGVRDTAGRRLTTVATHNPLPRSRPPPPPGLCTAVTWDNTTLCFREVDIIDMGL